MPTERQTMRRIRQILQMHFEAHASARVIARELGVGRSTVQGYPAGIVGICKVFPWAHFRKAKAAVKMHTQIDLRGNIPSF